MRSPRTQLPPLPASRTRRRAGRRRASARGRASVLIITMFILVVLSGLLLTFARSMRVEAIASANRLGTVKASAIERAAEQYVLSQVEYVGNGDALVLCSLPGQAIQVGDGYFWLIRPNPDDDRSYDFGLIDECSKLNLTTATDDQLVFLPNMTQDVADAIVDWRDSDDNITGQGAETAYYGGLPEPYIAKNAPFETVEELLLVKGPSGQMNFSRDMLYGYDLNHDGVVDDDERSAPGAGNAANYNTGVGQDTRGMFPYVTVYSTEPNTDPSTGNARINVNDAANSRDALQKLLSQYITNTSRVQSIMAQVAGTGNNRRYPSVIAWCQAAGLQPNEAGPIIPSLTTSSAKTVKGLININTAPRQVLLCLGLQQSDADMIVNSRGSNTGGIAGAGGTGITMGNTGSSSTATPPTGSDLTWLLQAMQPQTLATIAPYITTRSYQYSADIVAVTADARSFKRVRIVVDAQTLPAKIIYRKDLTSLGWPLPPDLRKQMSEGQEPTVIQTTTSGGVGLGGLSH